MLVADPAPPANALHYFEVIAKAVVLLLLQDVDSYGYGGFSCADPAWDAARWGATGLQSAFGFQNGYSSRCIELSANVSVVTESYYYRAACLPMACVDGNLRVRASARTPPTLCPKLILRLLPLFLIACRVL